MSTDAGVLSEVRELLRGFSPRDAEELDRWRRVGELLSEERENPFSRHSFRPGHLTASGMVLSPNRKQLLLIFHKKLQRWLQPGGHFEESDEGVVWAARREVEEETGLEELEVVSSLVDIDVHEIPALGAEPAHLHYDLRVLLRARTWDLRASEEVSGARWFDLGELSHGAGAETDASVLRVAMWLNQAAGS